MGMGEAEVPQFPTISNSEFRKAFSRAQGKAAKAAKFLHIPRSSIVTRWERLGLVKRKPIPEIIAAHREYKGNLSEAAKDLPWDKSTISRHWRAEKLYPERKISPQSYPQRVPGGNWHRTPKKTEVTIPTYSIKVYHLKVMRIYHLTVGALEGYCAEYGIPFEDPPPKSYLEHICSDMAQRDPPQEEKSKYHLFGQSLKYTVKQNSGKRLITKIKIRED